MVKICRIILTIIISNSLQFWTAFLCPSHFEIGANRSKPFNGTNERISYEHPQSSTYTSNKCFHRSNSIFCFNCLSLLFIKRVWRILLRYSKFVLEAKCWLWKKIRKNGQNKTFKKWKKATNQYWIHKGPGQPICQVPFCTQLLDKVFCSMWFDPVAVRLLHIRGNLGHFHSCRLKYY